MLDSAALLHGALVTAAVSGAAIVCGIPLGLVLALIRWRRVVLLSSLVAFYVSVLRATPLITLSLLVFFALPALGFTISAYAAAVLTLLLNTSAFNCEIWRSALEDFSFDQLEAARAFGMSTPLMFRRIIFPQIWRSSLPPLVNEMTLLVKASPAIAVIGVVDLTQAANRIGADTYQPLPPILAATVLYIALVLVLVALQRIIERSVRRKLAA